MTRVEETAQRLQRVARAQRARGTSLLPPTLVEEPSMTQSRFVESHRPASWETVAGRSAPVFATIGPGEVAAPARASSTAGGREVIGRLSVSPSDARRLRAGLDARVRLKLEGIEQDAAAAHAGARLAQNRATQAREELRQLRDRLSQVQALHPDFQPGRWRPDPSKGPSAQTWTTLPGESTADLEIAVAGATRDLERLDAARDEAIARWQRLGRLAESCARYLGVPGR